MLSMFKVRWKFPLGAAKQFIPSFPFPYRTKSGAILFPSEGYSWLMRDELAAGLKWMKALDLENGLKNGANSFLVTMRSPTLLLANCLKCCGRLNPRRNMI